VVREPKSGNIGSIDLATNVRTLADAPRSSEANDPTHILVASSEPTALGRPGKSLGSPLPKRSALCGDVDELPLTTTFLPGDFKVLNAVGAVYTKLAQRRGANAAEGVPGSTLRHEWFGIDYYGEFWVSIPRRYLLS
jgi:hypothetical protein